MKLLILSLFMVVAGANASTRIIGEEDLVRSIMDHNVVSRKDAEQVVSALATANGGVLPEVKGMMFLRGFDVGLIGNHAEWRVRSMTVYDKEIGRWIDINTPIYSVTYDNPGIAGYLGYKWHVLFFTLMPHLEEIENSEYAGRVFNRGVSVDVDVMSVGLMSGVNRPGYLYTVGAGIGIGAGVTFPKMTFHKLPLYRNM